MCLLWAEMGAVDVAFTEATVGAGISTVVLVATIFNLKESPTTDEVDHTVPGNRGWRTSSLCSKGFPRMGEIRNRRLQVSGFLPLYK